MSTADDYLGWEKLGQVTGTWAVVLGRAVWGW